MIPAGAPPLHPARGIMPLDPKFLYNIAPSVAALPASLGALLLKQEQVSPSTMSLFRRRNYAPLSLVAIRACSDEICLSGMPDRNNTNRVQRRRFPPAPTSLLSQKSAGAELLAPQSKRFSDDFAPAERSQYLHIVKFRLCKSAEKNCSEAGSYYSGLAYEQISTCVRFCCHRVKTKS